MANRRTTQLITHRAKRCRKITTMENRNSAVFALLFPEIFSALLLQHPSVQFFNRPIRTASSQCVTGFFPPGTFIIEPCQVERAYRLRYWEYRDMVRERVRSCLLTWKCSVQNLKYSLWRFPRCLLAKVAYLSRHHDEGLQKCALDVWWNNFAPLRADFAVLWHSTLRILRPAGCHISQFGPFWYIQIKIPFHVLSLPAGRHNKFALCYKAVLPLRGGALITSGIDFGQDSKPPPTWGMMSQQFMSQSCTIFCLPLPSTICTLDPLGLN